jgi:tRNA wybutosine-synthesizing protein 2
MTRAPQGQPAAEKALREALGVEWGNILRRGFERYGDLIVVQFRDGVEEQSKEAAARAIAKALKARSVVEDQGGIQGPLREPKARLIFGKDSLCTHKENGISYNFDAREVMFASGNQAERARMGALACRGEKVVDLFAGIGYFAVPIAVLAKADRVYACELNPASHKFLVENARINRAGSIIDPMLGDCHKTAPKGVADRVVMGYVHGTADYLPTALACLKPAGGVVHYHEAYPQETKFADARAALKAAAGKRWDVLFLLEREVKSFAPGIDHVVVDARFTPHAP